MRIVSLFVITLVAFSFSTVGVQAGPGIQRNNELSLVKQAKINLNQARVLALKEVEGLIEEEFSFEEEDGTVLAYVFKIRDKQDRIFEVQVDADSGEILYAEADPAF